MKSARIQKEINFFYLCLFTVTLLFLTTFVLRLRQINSNVLGMETESTVDKIEASKEINFWNEFMSKNPQYYEGWAELYNLTGNENYLIKATEIDPNR